MKLLLVLSVVCFARFAFAGGEVTNGGHIIYCESGAETGLSEGYYSLDFLIGKYSSSKDSQPSEVYWLNSIERIISLLHAKKSPMAQSLEQFLLTTPFYGVPTETRGWVPTSPMLTPVPSSEVTARLPRGCYCKGQEDGTLTSYQAVVRVQRDEMIRYYWDPDVIRILLERDLQFSFLLIHEWLWDWTYDYSAVVQLNNLFHSSEFENMSEQEFLDLLKRIGVNGAVVGSRKSRQL